MVWQTLLLRCTSYFDLQVQKSKLTIQVGILFIKQNFLEKRIDGAKMIDQVCKKAINELVTTTTNSENRSLNLLIELIETLRENNVIDLFFSSKNIHAQLVQRSEGLLKLMLKRQALTDEELEMVWSNCLRHDSMALGLINVLKGIAYTLESKELSFFAAKILVKTPT